MSHPSVFACVPLLASASHKSQKVSADSLAYSKMEHIPSEGSQHAISAANDRSDMPAGFKDVDEDRETMLKACKGLLPIHSC